MTRRHRGGSDGLRAGGSRVWLRFKFRLARHAGTTDAGDGVGGHSRYRFGQMIRKGQVLGITRQKLDGQASVFGSLLALLALLI
jgi:hypothetical protein